MRIIAYTYEAAYHCVECTLRRHAATPFALTDPLGYGKGEDTNGLPYAATDREGNSIQPLFDDQAGCYESCADCLKYLTNLPILPA